MIRSMEAMVERDNRARRERILNLRQGGLTYAEIGREMGLTRERVRQIVVGKKNTSTKLDINDPDALLRTAEAARLLNVHVNTIRRWSDKEILATLRIGPRGDRRFRLRDLNKFLQQD